MINRKINIRMWLFILALMIPFSTKANSEQEIILSIDHSLQFAYDSFSGLPSIEELTVNAKPSNNLENSATAQGVDTSSVSLNRRFGLIITPVNGTEFQLSRNNESSLPIEIRPLKDSPYKLDKNIFQNTVNIVNSKKEILNYQFIVPESIYADTGKYSLDVEIHAIDLDSKNQISNKVSTQIEVNVIPKLQTNLAGVSGKFKDGKSYAVLDFEELTTGESKTVFIQVRGNALANINISSENNGKMVHQKYNHLFIPYSVNVDGEKSMLSTPMVLSRRPEKNLNGSAYPMDVIIGNADNKYAGIYRDIINVNVTLQ